MDFAQQLKSQLDIVRVVEEYVRLKQIGRNFKGLCPFHNEKSPSFHVHTSLQIFKCFGCDAGGDVFEFIKRIEALTFPETLKLLADRFGIPIPERQSADDPLSQRRDALFEMHELAARQFQDNLRGPNGIDARQYLNDRGVSADAINEFRIGLSDVSGQQLVQRFQKFGGSLMEESGLVLKRSDGSGWYDRFRGRLMFPIHNEAGKVIAFGGRALRPNDEPKYLNSPSPDEGAKIYKKSEVLYNLHRAKSSARKNDRMILVEGYMDAIGVYASGIQEVVAICGTSLSVDQVRSIKRQVAHQGSAGGQVVMNLDPDAAGARSTEKYISVLLAEGLRVRVLELAGGLDPDEFIQANGVDAYLQQVAKAPSYFHWLAERARGKFDMSTAEGRVDAFKFLWPAIQQVTDRLERSAIANDIAEYLKVDRDMVREQFRRIPQGQAAARPREHSSFPPNERLLLTCMLLSADARIAIQHYLAQAGIMQHLETKSVFEAVQAMEAEGIPFSMDTLGARVEPRVQRLLTELSFSDLGIQEETATGMALQCLTALEAKAAEANRTMLRRRVRELEQQGDLAGAMKLAEELNSASRASFKA